MNLMKTNPTKKIQEDYRGNGVQIPPLKKMVPMPSIKPAPQKKK